MVKGKPRLATWNPTDGLLRLFEMDASDVFVQFASAPLANVGSYPPDFAFSRSGDFLLAGGNRVAATFSEAVFDMALVQTGLATWALSSTALRLFAKNYKYGMQLVAAATPAYIYNVDESNGSLLTDVRTSILNLGATNTFRNFSSSGNDILSFYNTSPFLGIARASGMVGTPPNDIPAYPSAAVRQTAFNVAVIEGSFSQDLQLVYTGAANGTIYVCPFNPAGAVSATSVGAAIQTIPGTGTVHRISVSPDDKFVAVSRLNAGVYTTVIYQRSGTTLTAFATIASFGQSLMWTGDGYYLIDAISKKALHYTGTFDNADAILANLPATVTSAAVSQHVDGIPGLARLYNVGAQDLATCATDLTQLKVMLLSPSASFDATQATLSAVTNAGAYEVSGGGWPAGGTLLTGVAKVDGPAGTTIITANDLAQSLTAPLTFQFALIYDDATDVPIALIDYLETIAAPALTSLQFDFSAGVVHYVPV